MYIVILAIKFLIDIENVLIGKQDSSVRIFLEPLQQTFVTFITYFLSLPFNKWLTWRLYTPKRKFSQKIRLGEQLEMFV